MNRRGKLYHLEYIFLLPSPRHLVTSPQVKAYHIETSGLHVSTDSTLLVIHYYASVLPRFLRGSSMLSPCHLRANNMENTRELCINPLVFLAQHTTKTKPEWERNRKIQIPVSQRPSNARMHELRP